MQLVKTFGLMLLTMVVLAAPAFAQDAERRTQRVDLAGGIVLYPTTTTDFGGTPLNERFQGAGGDAAAGDGAAAGAAAGTSGGEGCSR